MTSTALVRTLVIGVILLSVSLLAVSVMRALNLGLRDVLLTRTQEVLPSPWLIAKKRSEAELHLAMVHDVLHERFVRHGTAWHEARLLAMHTALAAEVGKDAASQDRRFAMMDDLAVSLERLGRPLEGIVILRQKLAQQTTVVPGGRVLPEAARYTTYANLGTLLIHAHLALAMAGDATGLAALTEGLSFIRAAMAANPDAHFGRETWQAEAVAALLAAIHDPNRLMAYDLIGLRLGSPVGNRANPRFNPQAYRALLAEAGGFVKAQAQAEAGDELLRERIRQQIPAIVRNGATATGAQPVPFDEPTLGLLGMWTLGGGANPHSALALGHLMEVIQQRRLAWAAYERASELGERFWPDATLRQSLLDHCHDRQHALETELGEKAASLRRQHQDELAAGLAYRKAYDAEEAAQLAAGMAYSDPDLMRAFFASHPPIATPTGREDTVTVDLPIRWYDMLPPTLGGLSALVLLAWALNRWDRRNLQPA